MPLIQFVMALITVGVLLWLVNRYIPMASPIKSILNAVVVIGVVLWVLDVFGFMHTISGLRVGRCKTARSRWSPALTHRKVSCLGVGYQIESQKKSSSASLGNVPRTALGPRTLACRRTSLLLHRSQRIPPQYPTGLRFAEAFPADGGTSLTAQRAVPKPHSLE
jgi:hypothetical protein